MTSISMTEPLHEAEAHPSISLFLSNDFTNGATKPRRIANVAELQNVMCSVPNFPRSCVLDSMRHSMTNVSHTSVTCTNEFAWVHCKHLSRDDMHDLLTSLPLHSKTHTKIMRQPREDTLEYFPTYGYAFLSLLVCPVNTHGSEVNQRVKVYILAFANAVISFCDGDFKGEEDVCADIIHAAANGSFKYSGVAYLVSSIVSIAFTEVLSGVSSLLVNADQLDEIMLEVMPSRVDQDDLLVRLANARHQVSKFNIELLLKDRLIKHLLLPVMADAKMCIDEEAKQRYKRTAAMMQRSIEKLRKCRDLVNMSNMNLISGVSSRLLRHCNFMDYVNHIQTQIALIIMPISLLPALFASNVQVPFQDNPSMWPFIIITTITMSILVFSCGAFGVNLFRYKVPTAMVKTFE